MKYLPEIVMGTLLLVIGIIYLINKFPRYREEKYRLLTKYRKTQNTSLKVQDILSKYVLANDAFEENLMPGVSYGEHLRQLQNEYARYLSKETYLKIRNSNNKRVLRKIDHILNEQFTKLGKTSELLNDLPELHKKSPGNSELYTV